MIICILEKNNNLRKLGFYNMYIIIDDKIFSVCR